ncbi:beta' subunit [Perkinsus chesapeaki]|uniref:Succinate--CoA ligase [ADP-forming] subunit beta, mitochondrial n=1 Tax=Perkinsus chesapeaki TaxID=330153 RepID=A0A7J6MKQ1_PERCH|nr:beta' subunit [Perkinsus chesapeaki]
MLPTFSSTVTRSSCGILRHGVLPMANAAMFSTLHRAHRVFVPKGQQVRHLNLHEHQSLGVFKKYGVCVPHGYYATSPEDAEKFAQQLGGGDVVVKAQVLAGGRGRGYFKENGFQGGVHIVKNPIEAKDIASKMIGKTLVTKQTGEAGKPCNGVFLSERFQIASEKYFAILMDRSFGGPVMVGSKYGGMSIEDVAAEHPDAIIKIPVDINSGISDGEAREMAEKIGFQGEIVDEAVIAIKALYDTFRQSDCTMVEINPLAETSDGRVMVCDAKVNFDDNAQFRQKCVHSMRDRTQEDPREVAASEWDLNYIGLDGNIGCMVNGAGLAMATMDLLSLKGGSPANFLDVGGSAQADQVKAAFEILEKDPKVKSILVNIFGGIMRCDVIAQGVVQATTELNMQKPIVIRLVGTNVEQGKQIIKDAGLKVYAFDDLNEAAGKAVSLAQ